MIGTLASRGAPDFGAEHLFINGRAVKGRGDDLTVTFPATGEILAKLNGADASQVDEAMDAARRTFDRGVWRDLGGEKRGVVLDRVADRLEAVAKDLARQVIFDNAKTTLEAEMDVRAAVATFRWAARCARELRPAILGDERGVSKEVWREPIGVVAALTPFNAPLPFAALKCAPALAAGNSVVLKPSERAPLLAIRVARAAAEAGLPEGVLNVLHGGTEVASAISGDPRTDMVTLTGGTPAGTAVMKAAAPSIKRLLLELGGKSAHIVLGDADLDAAVPAIIAGIFRNSGQRCFSGSRLVVEASIAEEVEEKVARLAESLVVGDPFEPATQVGALIDDRAVTQATTFVERARAEGLSIRAGGTAIHELRPGSFFRPTVLVGAKADSTAAQEEIFGPVLTVIRVRDAEEAVAVANATPFGLAGGVWTRSEEKARFVASRVRCGYFWVNTYAAIFGDMPFGGYGRSGLGREAGPYGFEAYTELKSVLIDRSGGRSAPLF